MKLVLFFLFLLGVIFLILMEMPIPAGICILIGAVIILESIWPEKWITDEYD